MKQAAAVADRVFDESGEIPEGAQITDHERALLQLASDVHAAEAEMQTRSLMSIREAGGKDWRATAWMLERRFPKQFGVKAELEHTGKDGGPLTSVIVMPALEPVEDEQDGDEGT